MPSSWLSPGPPCPAGLGTSAPILISVLHFLLNHLHSGSPACGWWPGGSRCVCTSPVPFLQLSEKLLTAVWQRKTGSCVIHAVSCITDNWKTPFKIRNEEADGGWEVSVSAFLTSLAWFMKGFFTSVVQWLAFFPLFSPPSRCRASAGCSKEAQQLYKPICSSSTASFHNLQFASVCSSFRARMPQEALWCVLAPWFRTALDVVGGILPLAVAGIWPCLQKTSCCWSSDAFKPNLVQSVEPLFFCWLTNCSPVTPPPWWRWAEVKGGGKMLTGRGR